MLHLCGNDVTEISNEVTKVIDTDLCLDVSVNIDLIVNTVKNLSTLV